MSIDVVDPACLGNAIQSAARQLSDPHSLEFVNAYIDTQQLNTEQANSLSQVSLANLTQRMDGRYRVGLTPMRLCFVAWV